MQPVELAPLGGWRSKAAFENKTSLLLGGRRMDCADENTTRGKKCVSAVSPERNAGAASVIVFTVCFLWCPPFPVFFNFFFFHWQLAMWLEI